MVVALGGHFNDVYMGQTYMVGNFLPISVIGLLTVLVMVVSPLLHRISPRYRLRPAELAVIVALPLAACVVPGSGFLRSFTPAMMLPIHYEKTQPSWQKNQVLSFVPEGLIVKVTDPKDEEAVLGSFLQGKGTTTQHISLQDVPWNAWMPVLKRWVPFFLVFMIALIGLSVVFHRQWSTHEHLVYPVAEFVKLLTGGDDKHAYPAILRRRVFWYAFSPVLLLHLVNGFQAWRPSSIAIPHMVDITPIKELFPMLSEGFGSGFLWKTQIYFSIVAFAYFLPSDIALSLGLAAFMTAVFSGLLLTYGINATYEWIGAGEIQGLMFGAYLAMFVMILYSGRAYYARVLAASFTLRGGQSAVEPVAVWGCRIFLFGSVVAAFIMHAMGLPWLYAVLMLLLFVILFSCMSRACAETGLVFMQPSWQAAGVLVGLMGSAALGPEVLAVAALLCVVISIDPREAMMPYIVNALRIGENAGVKRSRLAPLMTATLVIGLIGGLAMVLWLQYDRGVGLNDGWATSAVPRMGLGLLDTQITLLKANNVFDQVCASNWLDRLSLLQPKRSFMQFLGLGFALFTVFAILRMRFSGWPLHPILFLAWFTFPAAAFSWSFFVGWAVKAVVVKFGGGNTYQSGKALMVGVIAGDLMGGLVFMVVGAVYYFITGFAPQKYPIFPG
jgi:hypothetical protein